MMLKYNISNKLQEFQNNMLRKISDPREESVNIQFKIGTLCD
jgi:hypothetical protein